MPTLDPAVLLLVAVGTLAIVGFLLWRLHARRDRGPRRDAIPADTTAVVVGDAARGVLDRAARLDQAELRQLDRGYRRLDRFWSGGPEERLREVADQALALFTPTWAGAGSSPLLRTSELRAAQSLGGAREQALLARAATAIEWAASTAGYPPSRKLARAVADAAMAADATSGLDADDRSMLAWPWRDATEHAETIPDPGTIVPLRLTTAVGGTVAVLAGLGIAGGSPPAAALLVFGLPGVFVVAAASLFRLMVWHPVLRVQPGPAEGSRAARGDPHEAAGRPPGTGGRAGDGAAKPSILPRRLLVIMVGVVAVFAAMAVAGGSSLADAAIASAFLLGLAIAAVALFRVLVWRPIVRLRSGRRGSNAGPTTPAGTQLGQTGWAAGWNQPPGAIDAGDANPEPPAPPSARGLDVPAPGAVPRTPSFATGGPAGIDLPGLLLGILIAATFGIALYVVATQAPDPNVTPEHAVEPLGWIALLTAIPAFVAGIIGARSARGAARASHWVIAGMAVTIAAGLLVMAVTVDPGGEAWPWLVFLVPVLAGPPALLGYGAGALLANWLAGRPVIPASLRASPGIRWRRQLADLGRFAPFILAAIAAAALGPVLLDGTRAWFYEAPMTLSVLVAGLLVVVGWHAVTGRER